MTIINVTLNLGTSIYNFVAVGATVVVSRHINDKMIWSVALPRAEGRVRYRKLLAGGAVPA